MVTEENSTREEAVGRTSTLSPAVLSAAAITESPLNVSLSILIVFVLSPLIICGNVLLLTAVNRYKRLQTPSNCLVMSLATADVTVGLFLPFGVYFELTKSSITCPSLCVLPYCFIITVCSVSLISMTAIAIDRYTSLSQPLRYNNLITKTSINRTVAIFWIYSLILGSSPLISVQFSYAGDKTPHSHFVLHPPVCSFSMVSHSVLVSLFFILYLPCAVVVVLCYGYVYVIARYHAHAIYSVELSFRQSTGHPSHPRYGRTLALTVGLFLGLWLPFQVCMLSDAFSNTTILQGWPRIYLAFFALANSAANPWMYGYRNSEFRLAFHRILEELLTKLGLIQKEETRSAIRPGESFDMCSYASNVHLVGSPRYPVRAPYVPAETTDATTVYCETVINGDLFVRTTLANSITENDLEYQVSNEQEPTNECAVEH